MTQRTPEITEFKSTACSVCNICGKSPDAEFCYMLFQLMGKKFIERVVRAGLIADRSKLIDAKFLRTPRGFFETICNEGCDIYDENCKNPGERAGCYKTWLQGEDRKVTDTLLGIVTAAHQEYTLKYVVDNKQFNIDKAWISLSKKKRRKVTGTLKRIWKTLTGEKTRKNGKFGTKGKTYRKDTPKPTTAIFYNDDPKWVAHLNRVLNIKETDEHTHNN